LGKAYTYLRRAPENIPHRNFCVGTLLEANDRGLG